MAPQARKIPPQRALRDFRSLYPSRLGKPSPKTPVSERSERRGVFPAPRGHAPVKMTLSVGEFVLYYR